MESFQILQWNIPWMFTIGRPVTVVTGTGSTEETTLARRLRFDIRIFDQSPLRETSTTKDAGDCGLE